MLVTRRIIYAIYSPQRRRRGTTKGVDSAEIRAAKGRSEPAREHKPASRLLPPTLYNSSTFSILKAKVAKSESARSWTPTDLRML
jgi:hypothetical protein